MKNYKNILLFAVGLLFLNLLVNRFDVKLDLTEEARFTLSDASKNVINTVEEPVQVMVFLEGDFPAYFKRLRNETENLLQDFNAENSKVDYAFINPLLKDDDYIKSLTEKGLQASQISVQKSGKLEQILVFPWAIVKQGAKEIPVSLLSQSYAKTPEEQVEKSIENLEYVLTNAINEIQQKKSQKIAIIKGNGELDDLHLADFLMTLGKKYRLAKFTLDSLESNPIKTISDLQDYNLAIIAKPTQKFSDKEKFALDQFLMNGGKTLWLIDAVKAHKDTLMYRGKTYALNAELNLTDMFFAYGIRINPTLVKDVFAAPVTLKVGQTGNKPQFEQMPWLYSPLAQPNPKHPIGKNLDMVMMDFVSPIELLKNKTPKTVILSSSPKTQLIGVPVEINFDEIGNKPNINEFMAGIQNFGVLIEGNFKSAFNHRLKPVEIKNVKENGKSAMIVVSDGDIIKNQIDKGKPLALGFDKWSKMQYDNKQFLLNAVDYLMDSSGVISLKNKEVKLKLLDKNKIIADLSKWQMINTVIPLIIMAIFGFAVNMYRKKKYGKF
jgi:gliding-associated putative ABC transporter substrate-binding component GldG